MPDLPSRSAAPQPALGVFSGLDLIGDGLTKLPFLRAVRAAFPEHRITYITAGQTTLETALRPLTRPLIDEFLTGTGLGRSPRELVRSLPMGARFDVFIDTQPVVWRSLLLRRLCRGLFVTNAWGYRLSDRRPQERRRRPVNLALRLVELVELASGRPAVVDGAVAVPADSAAKAADLLPDGATYVGFAPGAGGEPKRWPLERFQEIARAQQALGRTPVFLLGPDEASWLLPITATVPDALFPLQARGVWGPDFDPVHTVALACRLAAAVANDSGTNQMMAAANVPLVTLFGPTNAEKFRPLVSRGRIVRAQDHGGDDMAAIPVGPVAAALEAVLDGSD